MTTERHSPEWLIENADHGIAFEVACASALTRLLAANAELQQQLEAIGAGEVGSKVARQDHHEQHLNMVPEGWKLVPVEPTDEMRDAGKNAHYEAETRTSDSDAWSLTGFAHRVVRASYVYRAMIAAAPQPPVVEQPQGEQQTRYLAGGARYKVTHLAFAGYCIHGLPREMLGQWVAFVDATDNKHMDSRQPQSVTYCHQSQPQVAPPGSTESAYQRGYLDGMSKGRRDAESDAAEQQTKREPLTDDAATRLVQSVVAGSDRPIGMVAFGLLVARSTERSHGIGGAA